jgi:cobalt-zinc-cadmium resistance protein CzcA
MQSARSLREAVREAGIGRVRPKLMTAGTAILGLSPLLVTSAPRHGDRTPIGRRDDRRARHELQ